MSIRELNLVLRDEILRISLLKSGYCDALVSQI